MTRVTFYQNRNGHLTGFRAADHAGYAETGEDIVCAAVSALVIHTINSIERFTSQKTESSADEEEAVILFSLKGEMNSDAQLLLKSLAQTLSDMQEEESYRDFVDVNFMEV
jgi:uncharacterized protein YsxB (DUF464 family)